MSKARRSAYWTEARDRFLAGTRFRSPVEAVESGARSVQDWCDVLATVKAEAVRRGEVPPDAVLEDTLAMVRSEG